MGWNEVDVLCCTDDALENEVLQAVSRGFNSSFIDHLLAINDIKDPPLLLPQSINRPFLELPVSIWRLRVEGINSTIG